MNELDCGSVRESIPGFVADGRVAADAAKVEGHVSACSECRAELELAKMLFSSRAEVPEGLAERIVSAVRRDRQALVRPWWGVSAAAVAALALGIGIVSEPSATFDGEVPDFAYEVEEGDLWLSDDGLLAGAPSFDDLSDEALLELLNELASGGTAGGAA
jgi:predicted anti-sigma-YlaC factor YlaD